MDSRIRLVQNLIERDDLDRAFDLVTEVLNDDPDNVKGIYQCGCVLRNQGRVGIALQMFRRALALERKVPNIWMHYAACLHDCQRFPEAREAFMAAHKMLPKDPMPMGNIAATFVQEGKAREAVEWADRALAIDPEHRIASITKAFACLALGRWADGWERAQYLYGDTLTIRVYNPPEREEPMWDGSKGKTVVVQADQGLGDMIMFSQCLPQMIADCKQVIVDTNKRLAPMFRRNFPGLIVYDTLKDTSDLEWPTQYEIDAHIHISWLGKYYRTKDEDFPRVPYLTADPMRVEKWAKFLADYPKPWVGIAWQGGIQRTNAKARSMKLEDLAPIIRQGGTFFSLAYQDVGLEVARWNIANPEQVICPNLRNEGDYEHTMGLIAALDHVVTVTTTAAHACGAMGKRAWVLVNDRPQWRYVHSVGDGLAWYPDTLRLYRQKHGEPDWKHAIARVAKDYETFLALRKAA